MKILCLFAGCMLTMPCCHTLLALQSETSQADAPDQDIWLGGIGCLDDDRFSWRVATLEFPKDATQGKGKLLSDDNRRFTIRINKVDDASNVSVTVRRRRVDRDFTGKMKDGVLVAGCEDGEVPSRLILRKIANVTPQRLDELAGMYTVNENHRISFRRQGPGLAMTDYQSGQVRFLYSTGDDQFVAGSAISIPDPVEFQFQFVRNDADSVSGVHIKTSESDDLAKRRPDPRVEEFVYKSFDGTKIAGSLYRPSGTGPFPAIICVHGSGRATRQGVGSWPLYFTDLGFAVLAVDKRGVGNSEGKYELPDGGRDNFPHMRRRSMDVAAAVKTLASRDDIAGDRIGLSGASQAGWVIPMTTEHADVAFAIILSGGVTPLSIEDRYSRMAAEDASGSQLPPIDELISELRDYQPTDPGIDYELSEMDIPGLWLYGYKDRSNPSRICEDWINKIKVKHDRDFTIKTFPEGNHGLLVSRFGGAGEIRALKQVVPGLYPTIRDWLSEKKLLPEQKK